MNRRLTRLFVSNIASKSDLRELERLFTDIGRLQTFEITGTSGYLEFENQKDASDAIRDLNDHKFAGKRITVEYAVKSTNKFVKRKREQYQNDKDSGRCFNCKEKGHIAKKCPKRQRDSSSRSSSRSSDRPKRKHHSKRKDSKSKSRSRSRSKSKSRDSSRSYSN